MLFVIDNGELFFVVDDNLARRAAVLSWDAFDVHADLRSRVPLAELV